MYIVIGLALGLILVGLAMVIGSKWIEQALLKQIVYWVGIVMVIIGLILALTPVLVWINAQLRAMIGVG